MIDIYPPQLITPEEGLRIDIGNRLDRIAPEIAAINAAIPLPYGIKRPRSPAGSGEREARSDCSPFPAVLEVSTHE